MKKLIIGGVVVILLGVGGYGLYNMYLRGELQTPIKDTIEVLPEVPVLNTYASSTLGITFNYPKGYGLIESYSYEGVSAKKPISGVKITIPETMATGTNLSSYDTGVSIEWLPRAKLCTGDIYLLANVKAQKITENGIDYSVATTTGAAAGNRYEEQVYALATSSPCTAIRYFIHSTVVENYPEGTVREYDRTKLLSDFDKVRQSLILQN